MARLKIILRVKTDVKISKLFITSIAIILRSSSHLSKLGTVTVPGVHDIDSFAWAFSKKSLRELDEKKLDTFAFVFIRIFSYVLREKWLVVSCK